ncbi:uncharacterized protein ARMOST_00042 [Armillaria ostoyae]|uniref:Uncharacterized protein n=1 Tax=Armillaria ostoyae TaxID=47428 RepID=A0A284QK11_ARMOS|nr:uncharacterized protein ARMOST_00042 [Armillaria ostoyae]
MEISPLVSVPNESEGRIVIVMYTSSTNCFRMDALWIPWTYTVTRIHARRLFSHINIKLRVSKRLLAIGVGLLVRCLYLLGANYHRSSDSSPLREELYSLGRTISVVHGRVRGSVVEFLQAAVQ